MALGAIIFTLSISQPCIAQKTDTLKRFHIQDSSFEKKLRAIKRIALDQAVGSIGTYNAERISMRQHMIIENIKRATIHAKAYLKKGIDTIGIYGELTSTQSSLNTVREGVFINKGTSQSQRNLTISANILSKLLDNLSARKYTLDKYADSLASFRVLIDSLNGDSVLYNLPSDSSSLVRYLQKLVVVTREIGPVDTAISQVLLNVQNLQTKVDLLVVDLRIASEEVDAFRRDLSTLSFKREFANIWEPTEVYRPFKEILLFSIAKEILAIRFYLRDNIFRICILVILVAISTFFIRSLRERLATENKLAENNKDQLIVKHPFASAIVIVLSLFQFMFVDPPFIFGSCLWFISTICLTIIFKGFITRYWFQFWCVLVTLFILASADNMILQASRMERWFIMGLSVFGILYGSWILMRGHRPELREKRILYSVVFLVIMETGSLFCNLLGRYNLSKTLLTVGFIGVIVAILFLWAIRLINEGLVLTSRIYKRPDKKFLYINFEKVGDRVPVFLYILVVLGWFILIAKNFYEFKEIADPFNEFLTRERMVGDYTFSVNSIFLFILILLFSLLLSKIISFFTTEPDATHPGGTKPKIALGSWILLVRILIISLGLYLAFAATGIPLNRITIVLGALGVGIGLGLQGLVNNLVSGLIIAFEKPVNVGDIIELNGKFGTVKSIGFRSSVVNMVDGSSIIIPNGEILDKEMVNWTTGKNIRRMTITVGVAYGTDLAFVKKILEEILSNDDRILKYPSSTVIIKDFNHSAIDFDVMFWVHDIRQALVAKSDVISRIDIAFKENKIVIPFQQTDIHVYPASKSTDRED